MTKYAHVDLRISKINVAGCTDVAPHYRTWRRCLYTRRLLLVASRNIIEPSSSRTQWRRISNGKGTRSFFIRAESSHCQLCKSCQPYHHLFVSLSFRMLEGSKRPIWHIERSTSFVRSCTIAEDVQSLCLRDDCTANRSIWTMNALDSLTKIWVHKDIRPASPRMSSSPLFSDSSNPG